MNVLKKCWNGEGQETYPSHNKGEIDLPPGTDVHSEEVYKKSADNFELWQKKGWLKKDEQPFYYIYAQTMAGKTQYGIVGCASVDDYMTGKIKKHELTRPDKEQDRMVHIRTNMPISNRYS